MSSANNARPMTTVTIKGVVYERVRYGAEYPGITRPRCHDCGVELGEVHIPGCDWEQCPACEGLEGRLQAISCGCHWEGYDPPEEDEEGDPQ